jgi:hypothetical protein
MTTEPTPPQHPKQAEWSRLVTAFHYDLLGRNPDENSLAYWTKEMEKGLSIEALYFAFRDCEEHQAKMRAAPLWVPPGHYYSPIVDPTLLRRSPENIQVVEKPLPGIDMKPETQISLLKNLAEHYGNIPFGDDADGKLRYHYRNEFFSYGDGIILSCFVQNFRPRRIIEVGSGYSSAVILDTIDFTPGLDVQCTFVEPYPERLQGLLKRGDNKRVSILPNFVQDVDISIFKYLKRNDILFIDSTHIVKTGSDVLYHITNTLPSLEEGVIIHFHDIFYPFEYPDKWRIDDNRSWNELYFLQAFLMNNTNYEILFFNDYMGKIHAAKVIEALPKYMNNSGGSLWLRKIAA